jgi:hypothetical protein
MGKGYCPLGAIGAAAGGKLSRTHFAAELLGSIPLAPALIATGAIGAAGAGVVAAGDVVHHFTDSKPKAPQPEPKP